MRSNKRIDGSLPFIDVTSEKIQGFSVSGCTRSDNEVAPTANPPRIFTPSTMFIVLETVYKPPDIQTSSPDTTFSITAFKSEAGSDQLVPAPIPPGVKYTILASAEIPPIAKNVAPKTIVLIEYFIILLFLLLNFHLPTQPSQYKFHSLRSPIPSNFLYGKKLRAFLRYRTLTLYYSLHLHAKLQMLHI